MKPYLQGICLLYYSPLIKENLGWKQSHLTNVESLASTLEAVAAGKRDGTVVIWGDAKFGGDPGSKQSQLTDVESITSTSGAFAAKKRDGTVVIWGWAPDGGDPVLVAQQGVHVHTVLDHQGRDRNQRKYLQQKLFLRKTDICCYSPACEE